MSSRRVLALSGIALLLFSLLALSGPVFGLALPPNSILYVWAVQVDCQPDIDCTATPFVGPRSTPTPDGSSTVGPTETATALSSGGGGTPTFTPAFAAGVSGEAMARYLYMFHGLEELWAMGLAFLLIGVLLAFIVRGVR